MEHALLKKKRAVCACKLLFRRITVKIRIASLSVKKAVCETEGLYVH